MANKRSAPGDTSALAILGKSTTQFSSKHAVRYFLLFINFIDITKKNNPLAQPAKLKTKPALSPVGLMFVLHVF
jgi:hypothetical protein